MAEQQTELKRFAPPGYIGLICIPWQISHHLIFCHRNARNDYHLFQRWLVLTNEIPARDQKVFGLSNGKSRQYWLAEERFNYYYYRAVNWAFFIGFSFVNLQYFLGDFDVPLVIFVLVQLINSFQNSHFAFGFLHAIYTGNLFFAQITRFMAKKFSAIGREVERMNAKKKINRRKLANKIYEFNRVQYELLEMNLFFREFVGVNILHFFR